MRSKKSVSMVLACMAVISIPASVFAYAYYGSDYFYATVYGSVGNNSVNYYSSYDGGLFFVGDYNTNVSGVSSAMAVGEDLIVRDTSSVVIGNYNADTGGDELLVLANGTYSQPANVLEVMKDGTMRIVPQGDIDMGVFAP